MIQDRGRIKWTSLYLPQHKKLIAQMYEAENDRTKPVIDEQRLEELQETAVNAIQEHRPVRVTYYENKRFRLAVGCIEKVDPLSGQIHLDTGSRPLRIAVSDILNLELHQQSEKE